MSETENILKQKIFDFGNYLISICNSEQKKYDIQKQLSDMKIEQILLFLMFLNENRINQDINDLIIKFELVNNSENIIEIKKHINYFIQIKNLM